MAARDNELIELIRAALAAHADPDRAAAQQRYMRSAMPFWGICAPDLRRVLRPLLGDQSHRITDLHTWSATAQTLWDEASHREERYAATALTGHRWYQSFQTPMAVPLYRHMIVTGAWWDHVDELAARRVGGILRDYPRSESERMRAWARQDDLWLRRSAIIAQLSLGGATDLDLLGDVIDANLEGSPFGAEFFIRKAIGWALRQYARTDPEWVLRFVSSRGASLSGLSRREACKHLGTPSPR